MTSALSRSGPGQGPRLERTRDDSATLAAALGYAAMGWAIFPGWSARGPRCACGDPACPNAGKHPVGRLVPHGKNDASTDAGHVEASWTDGSHNNIALNLAASGLCAIDVDRRHGGMETFAALEAALGPLPPTPTSKTGGGGFHLIFRAPQGRVRSRLARGVELLLNSSITLPPSTHASWATYTWASERSPEEVEVAELPGEWLAHASRDSRNGTGAIPEGERNATLTRLAGALWARGVNAGQLADEVHAANENRCEPPLDVREVDRIVKSITTHYERGFPLTDLGNAERLVAAHGLDLRYAPGIGWLTWDGTRWRRDDDGAVMRRAKATVRSMFAELGADDD